MYPDNDCFCFRVFHPCCNVLHDPSIDLQVIFFKNAIEDMASRSLRCVAIAYTTYDRERVPADEEQLSQWVLPEDDLVLLAIVGIKVCMIIFMKCKTKRPCI